MKMIPAHSRWSSLQRMLHAATVVILFNIPLLHPMDVHAQSKQSIRYEIDSKRADVGYFSKDALPRGREFKRLDSTYYVGWMFEGTYKFEHAADYLGFRSAATQLSRALTLLEKDFRAALKTRTSDVFTYLKIFRIHQDWDYVAYCLVQCYSNMEDPAAVWQVLQKCKYYDLQDENASDTYNYLAWTVHRNRFYTNRKFPFLRNSIEENERYANKLLDSSLLKIRRDAALNENFFRPEFLGIKTAGVWHYKSILYTYQLNIPSGAYYYEKLRQTTYFPLNNYATFCSIQGKFREAEHYYNLSKSEHSGDKRLNESYYYLSIINQYKGNCRQGIDELKSVLSANGSTPGFGWYNLALAREYLYNGQIELARQHNQAAAQFKEIHIGTTLGQSHYEFTTALLNLLIKQREIEQIKFLNKNWWYTPDDLGKIALLTMEKYGLQFLIINQFAGNPERDRVIYKLFSTESTVSVDEIASLLEGFSTRFFIDKFRQSVKTDSRIRVRRYYSLIIAKLLMKQGKYDEAGKELKLLLNGQQPDNEYEKLFLARVYEALSVCEARQETDIQPWLVNLYSTYPQLIPFSGLSMPVVLESDANTDTQFRLIRQLKQMNISWTDQSTARIPRLSLHFTRKGNLPVVQMKVSINGKNVIPATDLTYTDVQKAAKDIGLRLFGVDAATGNTDRDQAKK